MWNGPKWLNWDVKNWPKFIPKDSSEEKKSPLLVSPLIITTQEDFISIRFSKLEKLHRVVACCLRIKNKKSKFENSTNRMTRSKTLQINTEN